MGLFNRKKKEPVEKPGAYRYKLGIENCYGSLLTTYEFDSDKKLWDYIYETVRVWTIQKKDLINPTFIIQVYDAKDEMDFKNCKTQFKITMNELTEAVWKNTK